MNARLLQVASSFATLALPLAFLTGCPGDSSWEDDAQIHELSKGALVSVEATDEPQVEGKDAVGATYPLAEQSGAAWSGKGVYFFPPGMSGDAEITGPCPANQYDCNPPKEASVKVLEARTVDTISLRVASEPVILRGERAPTEVTVVVSTNMLPMFDCSKPDTCFGGIEGDASKNSDGTWTMGLSWYGSGSAEVTPRIIAYRPCTAGEACEPSAADHLTVVSTKLWK